MWFIKNVGVIIALASERLQGKNSSGVIIEREC